MITAANVTAAVITKGVTHVTTLAAATSGDTVARVDLHPSLLGRIYKVSGALQTCVASYIANVECTGHTLEALVPIENNATAADLVAQGIYEESLVASDTDGDLDDDDGAEPDLPDPELVAEMVLKIRGRMVRERLRVNTFLSSCCTQTTWLDLRKLRRLDLERYGEAYWEVVRVDVDGGSQPRDDEGNLLRLPKPVRLGRVNPVEVTLTKRGGEVLVYQRVRTSLVSVELRPTAQRFRRLKQKTAHGERWFKAYGDPRVMSPKTGRHYASVEELAAEEDGIAPATELMHFYLGEGPYGLPRWYGEVQSALGVRTAQETNLVMLNRGGIPGLAVIVTDGALTDDATKDLKNWAKQDLTGPEAMNKILVLQADGVDSSSTKIKIERLNGQQTDGLYLEFIRLGYDLLGRAFRLPKLLCGDAQDINRATAESALDLAESQVFAPERATFDAWMSKFLFEGLDVRYWDFTSNPARLRNAEAVSKAVNDAVQRNWLQIAEAREIGGPEVFGTELPVLQADWSKQPITLTLAGMAAVADPGLNDSLDVDDTPEGDELAAAAVAALARLRGGSPS